MQTDELTARVVKNEIRYGGYIELTLRNKAIALNAQPGQFVLLKGHRGLSPILGRPFDVADTNPERGEFRLVIKPTGAGTELMKSLSPGTEVPVTGPLGTAVDVTNFRSLAVLVRGVGAAAVTFLVRKAWEGGIKIAVFLSANTAERLVCREDFELEGVDFFTATDDGSQGYHGNITDLLEPYVAEHVPEAVYTCGSKRFARFVDSLDAAGRTRGFVFLEGFMACGVGNCHGCAVKRRNAEGYFLVCRDGPVFPVSEVVLP